MCCALEYIVINLDKQEEFNMNTSREKVIKALRKAKGKGITIGILLQALHYGHVSQSCGQ